MKLACLFAVYVPEKPVSTSNGSPLLPDLACQQVTRFADNKGPDINNAPSSAKIKENECFSKLERVVNSTKQEKSPNFHDCQDKIHSNFDGNVSPCSPASNCCSSTTNSNSDLGSSAFDVSYCVEIISVRICDMSMVFT